MVCCPVIVKHTVLVNNIVFVHATVLVNHTVCHV